MKVYLYRGYWGSFPKTSRELMEEKMKNISMITFFCIVLAGLATPVMALEPPTPDQVRQYKEDGSWQQRLEDAYAIGNHKMDPELAARADYKLRNLYYQSTGMDTREVEQLLTPPPAWQGMPSTGDVKMFILLIEFNDAAHISTADDQAAMFTKVFGPENTASSSYPLESLTAYYDRASYGLLNIQGATLGWYNPGTDRSAVPETTAGRETLIKNAINSFDAAGHDFSQYDNDGDGDIDYFAVIWTGAHGAWASFWWGYQTSFTDNSYTVDGKKLSKYSWQWESYDYPAGSFSPKVLIHETGHALGLPDYYDYDPNTGPDGGVGGLDMMAGNYGDHNSFSKFVLDWLTPTVISATGSYPGQTLRPLASFHDSLLVMPGAATTPFQEFFLVEHRKREKNDTPYPTDGLLIWHVDAQLDASGSNYLYDNSYTDHKLLRLMEADGLEQIETLSASADAGDFYTIGDSFTPFTTPDSTAYSNTPTGIEVSGITAAADSMSFDVNIGSVPAVTVTSPAALSNVSGTVVVTATASSDNSIAQVEFFVNTTSLGIDTTAPYTASWDSSAANIGAYTIKAVVTDSLGTINDDTVVVYHVTNSSQALVIDLASDNQSGEKIGKALAANNVLPVHVNTITAIDSAVYPLVFVCLGYYDYNHIISSTESGDLVTYLNNGGKLYLEGGDFWVWDQDPNQGNAVPLFDYFGITGLADGSADLATVTGSSSGLAAGISFAATGINAFVDQITTNGGTAIWENSSPVYTLGVSNQTAVYQTIGCSFEFGNIPDEATQISVMGRYLSFFGISTGATGGKKICLPAIFELLLAQ
jgi:M6 family metalloprotease-like protein